MCQQRLLIGEEDGLCSPCSAIKAAADFAANATPEEKAAREKQERDSLCTAVPFSD